MNEMIENILKHKNDGNAKICDELIYWFKRYQFTSIEDVISNELARYTFAGSNYQMTDEEIVEFLFKRSNKIIYDDICDEVYDYVEIVSPEVADEAELLKSEFLETEDIDLRYIIMIKIYSLYDWDVVLPYHAYKYITEGRL